MPFDQAIYLGISLVMSALIALGIGSDLAVRREDARQRSKGRIKWRRWAAIKREEIGVRFPPGGNDLETKYEVSRVAEEWFTSGSEEESAFIKEYVRKGKHRGFEYEYWVKLIDTLWLDPGERPHDNKDQGRRKRRWFTLGLDGKQKIIKVR